MEQALTIKSLRLVTTGISIIFIFIVVTLVYSGYQEATYVMQSLGQQESNQIFVMNATHISISGFRLENRGVYPLTIAVDAQFGLEGTNLDSSSFGPLTIPPGGQGRIDLSLPIQMDQALSNPILARKVLFNNTLTSIRFKITGGMQPFISGTVSIGMNNTIGAVLDGLDLRIGDPKPHNETHIRIPLRVRFTNKSPLPFDATLSAQITSTPIQPVTGNYGSSGVLTIHASPGQSYEGVVNIDLARNAVGPGEYVAEFNLSFKDLNYSWKGKLEG